MAERLVDELRRRVEQAQRVQARQAEEQARQRQARGDERAREIIKNLPALLRQAADCGKRQVELMKLDGYAGDFERPPLGLGNLWGQSSVTVHDLRGTALQVYTYLSCVEGLQVEIQARHQYDEGQGRAWTDYVMIAKL